MDEHLIKIVYFAYLLPNIWLPIITEQLDALKSLELYEKAKNIYFSVIADDVELATLKSLLNEKYQKIEIINHYYENLYEYPGIKAVYDISNENEDDTIILYFHSKGMTSNQHGDRNKLFEKTIKNYELYINEFKTNKDLDVACALPHSNGFAYYNFFWIRSVYVKKWVNDPVPSPNRYIWECWIGNSYSKKENVVTYSPFLGYNTIEVNNPSFGNILYQ
jgi:hypothetical protein